jgi:hypothetical protein
MEKPRNAVPMGNLVLGARILLIDRPVSGQESFEQARTRWASRQVRRASGWPRLTGSGPFGSIPHEAAEFPVAGRLEWGASWSSRYACSSL